MAKSLRAKTKQANRRKKRQDENSYYAAVEAARVQKVSDRLLGKDGAKKEDEEGEEGDMAMEGEEAAPAAGMSSRSAFLRPREVWEPGEADRDRRRWRARLVYRSSSDQP
jgi:hypothetical protein